MRGKFDSNFMDSVSNGSDARISVAIYSNLNQIADFGWLRPIGGSPGKILSACGGMQPPAILERLQESTFGRHGWRPNRRPDPAHGRAPA